MVLEQHVAGLREERKRLQAEVEKAQAGCDALREQLQRVQDALDALTGSGKPRSGKKKAGTGVKTSEVVDLMKTVLRSGSLDEEELGRRVADQVKAGGKTLVGFKLRFKQALDYAGFQRKGADVSLAARGQRAASEEA